MVHIATWSIHVFYFSTVYTIPVSRRFVPVGYTVHFKQYSQMFYQQTFSVLMSPEVTTNVPDLQTIQDEFQPVIPCFFENLLRQFFSLAADFSILTSFVQYRRLYEFMATTQ